MNVTVESLGPCRKLLRVEVPVDRVEAAFEEVGGQYQKYAQLPGFRPGKSPKHLVEKNFADRIAEDARKKLFETSYRDVMEQQKLRVIVTLGVEEQSFGRGLAFSYTVTLEHAPQFELPDYKSLSARRETATAGPAEVEKAINILREQQASYNDATRPVQTGDIAVVDYKGTCEGRPITDFNPTARGLTEKQGMWMLIQENSFIPGFTEQLVGAQAGDTLSVKVTFPADFVISEVQGKEGTYEISVTGVKERVLPEVDDAFAKGFGAGSFEELKTGVQKDLQNELDFRSKRAVRDQLLKQLLGLVTFDLPESVLSTETRNLVYNIVNENQQRGVAKEVIESRKNEIFQSAQTNAVDRVKAAFVLNRIAEAEKITISNQEITQRVLALAEQNNMDPAKMVKTLQEKNAFPEIQQDILTGKVLEWLELNSKIEEVAAAPAA